jgi:hypothetical protein
MNLTQSLLPRSLVLVALLVASGGCGGDKTPDTTAADSGIHAASPTGFPCDVEAIVKMKCQTCHTDPPKRGAPIHILSYADTQVFPPDSTTKRVWEYMEMFIASGYMPYMGSPTGPLTEAEKATMLAWLKGGPVASTAICP